MNKELISKATRNKFREALVAAFTKHDINTIFDSENFTPKSGFVTAIPIKGERRILVEEYYANINFSSFQDVKKVVSAYEEIMRKLGVYFGYEDKLEDLAKSMKKDGYDFVSGNFIAVNNIKPSVFTPSLVTLSQESIIEHIEKANQKINANDFSGAITNAYTLVEEFLKALLHQTGTKFKNDEGDIKVLYKNICAPLNLSPDGEALESYLKSILQGLQQQISGLYNLANKMSDRHARRYNPAKHHAKLAINTAFSLCEFLLDSFHYQQERSKGK